MKKIKPRWIVIGVIVLALVAGVWRAMSNKRAQQAAASAPVAAQTQIELANSDVVRAEQREITQGLDISGTVKALNYAVIKARVAGEVKEVLVREGDHVKAGQVLAHQEALFCWVSKQQVCDNAMEEDLEKENWLDYPHRWMDWQCWLTHDVLEHNYGQNPRFGVAALLHTGTIWVEVNTVRSYVFDLNAGRFIAQEK